MNIKVKNIARRLVSLHCNSGQTVHFPPDDKEHELAEVEVAGNAMFKKLIDNKLLRQVEALPSAVGPAAVPHLEEVPLASRSLARSKGQGR